MQPGPRVFACLVAALERDHLHLVDAAVASRVAHRGALWRRRIDRGITVGVALVDRAVALGDDRRAAGLAIIPATLDAVMVLVVAGIDRDLPVLQAVGATLLVGRLRGHLAHQKTRLQKACLLHIFEPVGAVGDL